MRKIILFLLLSVVGFGQYPSPNNLPKTDRENFILQDTTKILGFGKDTDEYGFRQNNGSIEYRNRAGSWLPIYAATSANIDTLIFYASLVDTNSNPPFRMSINAASVTISMKGTGLIRVLWGDGTYSDSLLTSTAKNITHTYASSAARNIVIYNAAKITYWNCSDNAAYNFDWAQTNRMRLTAFYCSGSNTLSGTLSLPASMTTFVCYGSNTLSGYTTQAFSNNINYFYLITTSGTGFSAAEVDQLIIDLDGSAWAGDSRTLRMSGAVVAAPTATSAAARASLTGKSVTQTYTP
ncbi:MAG: hypothetical protein AUJ54_06590 [Ignavibacteria bacterium CG1_02_37_35]|nr:MAG: hypothetical protein AUJ54_06590 [Ignavibacteria bacterium CG1_02_37_35]